MVSHELRHMPENKHYIDGHTHLENGDLSKDTVYAFIQAAINKSLKHIQILDHTHRFYEFKDMYEEICKIDVQREWFEKKQKKFNQRVSCPDRRNQTRRISYSG